MMIYYADKHFLIVVLINTDAVQTRCGMFKSVRYFVFEFVALIGDDRKLACVFQARYYPVADNARNERVNDAQTNGFIIYNESVLVYSVHEQTCKRDDGIENKRHVKEIQVRTNNAHVLGNDIRSARGRIVFNRKTDAKAHDKPRDKRRIYRIMPVGNVFEIPNETYLIVQYVCQRIRHRKSQRFNGEFLFDFEKGENIGGLKSEPYSGKQTGTRIRWLPASGAKVSPLFRTAWTSWASFTEKLSIRREGRDTLTRSFLKVPSSSRISGSRWE